MKKIKNLLTACATLILTLPSYAAPLSPQQALQRASDSSLDRKPKGLSFSGMKLIKTGDTPGGSPAYYVFANTSEVMFVSADDVAKPLLGYSSSSDFDVDNLPPSLKWWLDMYASEIEWAINKPGSTGLRLKKSAKTTKNESPWQPISPLVSTVWNQTEPFNNYCPEYNGERTVTGCVATSMSQVMNYWQWPTTYVSAISYKWNNTTLSSPRVKLDWANMKDLYNSDYTSAQGDAVARLMQLAGYSVSMQYDISANGGSGAYSPDICAALVKNFGYDKAINYLYRDFYTYDEWKQLIYDNLRDVGPVIYNGRGSLGGHSFVCDGFDGDDSFHINWGWGGTADGYFVLSALNPGELGTGGGSGGFNYGQGAVVGIQQPQPNSVAPDPFVGCNTSLTGEASGWTLRLKATDEGAFWNFGYVSGDFLIGLRLVNKTTGETYVREIGSTTLEPLSGFGSVTVGIESSMAYGEYEAKLIYKVNAGDWQLIRYYPNQVNFVTIDISSSGVSIEEDDTTGEITLEGWNCPTGFKSGQPYTGYLTVYNSFSTPKDYSLQACMCVEDGEYLKIVEMLDAASINIPAKSNAVMEFSGTLSDLEPGSYYLVFLQGEDIAGGLEVEVEPADEEELGEITLEEWDCPTGFVSQAPFEGYLTVYNSFSTPQDFSLDAYLCVIDDGKFSISANLGTASATIPAKSDGVLMYSGTLSEMAPGSYYLVFAQNMSVVAYLEVEVFSDGIVECTELRANSDQLVKGEESIVTAVIANTYPSEKSLDLLLCLCSYDDRFVIEHLYEEDSKNVTIESGEQTTVSFASVIPETIEDGWYYLVLVTSDLKKIMRYEEIEVISSVISGLNSLDAGTDDTGARYFNLRGEEISRRNLTPGIYIRIKNQKSSKILIR